VRKPNGELAVAVMMLALAGMIALNGLPWIACVFLAMAVAAVVAHVYRSLRAKRIERAEKLD
jgi:Flp pilus assembly protein TadB